ncbi:MAG: lipopolysaccharide transport system ATP-binding protein [Actinomycetota bacterium]|jgi:ABC-type polysaccharide/polyol phosphate transport system ATPase subunit
MGEPMISLVDVGKRYTKYEDTPMLASALKLRTSTKRSKLWAIRHVDFDVQPGECVGVIGRNGSGKSTMLQMLAGVTAPTEGRVTVRGKVAPLISVGVGFHPELTGRENVYVNAAILGLDKSEVDACFDSIVDFAEIAEFIDTPVKFYSSGMYVRLGFAVAVHVQPKVLLIDEVLAVGDINFQLKCFDKMDEIRDSGATIVIVSHNLNAIRRLCGRTMLLHKGAHRFTGETAEAISAYHEVTGEMRDPESDDFEEGDERVAHVTSWTMLDANGDTTLHANATEELTFEAEVEFRAEVTDPMFGVNIAFPTGQVVYAENTFMRPTGTFGPGDRTTFRCRLRPRLGTGTYVAGLVVLDSTARDTLAVAHSISFYMNGRAAVRGVVDLDGAFQLAGQELARPPQKRGG